MPLQNRVTPFNEIVANPARGAWMGNRGCLHDGRRRLTRRRWTTWAWVTCRLSFKGRKRVPMSPGRYTELFFLDEATALAAGHRPCFECRRADAHAFRDAWCRAFNLAQVSAETMNRTAHPERALALADRPVVDDVASLPDGAMVCRADQAGARGPDARGPDAWLHWNGALHRWTPSGYRESRPASGCPAILLTPPSTVGCLANGVTPQVHQSVWR